MGLDGARDGDLESAFPGDPGVGFVSVEPKVPEIVLADAHGHRNLVDNQ
jgi:hypothetical protein